MKTLRILLFGGLFILLSTPLLAAEEPIVYTVKKGDTLWGISQRFIKDPHYWPNLWSHNPTIGNPHLIYPGQTLYIYDGRIEIVPAAATPAPAAPVAEPAATAEPAAVAAGTADEAPVELVKLHGGAHSFISVEEVPTLGTLIDTTENRFLMYEGDTIFLEMSDLKAVAPGQQLELLELGKEIGHPVTGEVIGFQYNQMGVAEVTEITPDLAVAVIKRTIREVQRGARVRPYVEMVPPVAKKPATVALQGYIVASDEGNLSLSELNVIHVDLGTANGLEVGNELELFRKRVFTKSARVLKQLDADNFVTLPDIPLGKAVVIATREKTATALVLTVTPLPLYLGDMVKTVLP